MLASTEPGELLCQTRYKTKPRMNYKSEQTRQAKKSITNNASSSEKETATEPVLHLNQKASRRLHIFVHREIGWAKIRGKLRDGKVLNVFITQAISSEGQIISSPWGDLVYATVSIFCMGKPQLKAASLRDSTNASADQWLFLKLK